MHTKGAAIETTWSVRFARQSLDFVWKRCFWDYHTTFDYSQ